MALNTGWQQVSGDMQRLPVPGGWLYRSRYASASHYESTMTYVPDPSQTSVK